MRTRERIRARAAERHKAKDKALPVGQRPVKHLWLLTAVFSVNLLITLGDIWGRRSELPGLLHHFPVAGFASLHFLGWKFANVFLLSLLLVKFWGRAFQARAERQRAKEQRRAEKALGGEGVWPPPPRV